MPDFSRIIRMAYVRILAREPDPGGLAHYNGLMNGGTSEAAIREVLLRSPEYAEKNPSRAGARAAGAGSRGARRPPAGARKKPKPRKVR
jgi:uncharacterized protein DUF4214